MTPLRAFQLQVFKVALYALLSLFLIPLGALSFVQHAASRLDLVYVAHASEAIEKDRGLSATTKAERLALVQNHPPSSVCGNDAKQMARYRAEVCERYSQPWQFHVMEILARCTLFAGGLILLVTFAAGAVAFGSRRCQYLSFVIGWNLLRFASAAEVIAQGALLVWLSFWVTAFFFNVYYIKLIVIAALLAGAAVVYAIIGIFKRPSSNTGVEGELVSESQAPALWEHIRNVARHLGTAPPDHVIAGIDANFFVTESPLLVGQHIVQGRTLYVSLPLLRILQRDEADAVLGHELAHFRGGDTARSAALGSKLVQFDHYCRLMHGNRIPVFHLVYLFRVIFELALQRDSRGREFLADRVAAKLVSPQAIARSLVKIAAYSRYRFEIENQLFKHDACHSNTLGIAGQVAAGLAPYAASAHFVDAMQTANVPHPFDSHPAMHERMQAVGQQIRAEDYGQVVTCPPAQTWISDIETAADIEQRLWAAYEQQFAQAHEESLAYRYEPANDAEQAIVLKYFPPLVFDLKDGRKIGINYAGLELPQQDELLSWDRVVDVKYTDGLRSDVLAIVHPEKGLLGAKTTKLKLPGMAKEREQFKATLGHYWRRHRLMREQTAAAAA